MLLIETILYAKEWSIIEWEQSYIDLPNKQVKVKVKDRNIITTTNAERQCVTPIGLQDEIDKVVANYSKGRSFIRYFVHLKINIFILVFLFEII